MTGSSVGALSLHVGANVSGTSSPLTSLEPELSKIAPRFVVKATPTAVPTNAIKSNVKAAIKRFCLVCFGLLYVPRGGTPAIGAWMPSMSSLIAFVFVPEQNLTTVA